MFASNTEAHGTRSGNRMLGIRAYADDMELIGEYEKSLGQLTDRILVTAKRVGLEISADKTEYLKSRRRVILDRIHKRIWFNREFDVNAKKLKNLAEIKARLQAGN